MSRLGRLLSCRRSRLRHRLGRREGEDAHGRQSGRCGISRASARGEDSDPGGQIAPIIAGKERYGSEVVRAGVHHAGCDLSQEIIFFIKRGKGEEKELTLSLPPYFTPPHRRGKKRGPGGLLRDSIPSDGRRRGSLRTILLREVRRRRCRRRAGN